MKKYRIYANGRKYKNKTEDLCVLIIQYTTLTYILQKRYSLTHDFHNKSKVKVPIMHVTEKQSLLKANKSSNYTKQNPTNH